ncbi:MAG TPA: HD domain-containing phosphohydrolase [Solirubrobacteraceae bacterium]
MNAAPAPGPSAVRLADALTALSLATDAGKGAPLEKSLRTAVIATRLGSVVGLRGRSLADVYYVALLRSLGCTAYAPETAALLGGDDVAFHALYDQLDPGHPAEFVRDVVTRMGAWADPAPRARSVARFLTVGPRVGPIAGRAACEVSTTLAGRLGLSHAVAAALLDVYERWDGRGIPDGKAGERLALPARITHVADQAEMAHRAGGPAAARAVALRRSGGHFDPEVARAFAQGADEILAGLDDGDMLVAALEAEPAPHASFARGELERVAHAFADFADLKSPWMHGHSPAVSKLAAAASAEDDRDEVRLAGLLHDLGRVSVPNGIWDRPDRLTAAQWERVRLYPHYTERILARTAAFAGVASLAASSHERVDGGGYHRGLPPTALSARMRVLAAADAYRAMTAERPYRPALSRDAAAGELRAEVAAGRLCPKAVEAVLEAAGHAPAARPARPADLTEREVEVLLLLARGMTNKEIAARLVVSPRTIQHHVAHIYLKIDRRTRAGAAMFAMEQGLAAPE